MITRDLDQVHIVIFIQVVLNQTNLVCTKANNCSTFNLGVYGSCRCTA